ASELAGKQVSFNVSLKALAVKDVPALDDEFAKDHGECETLEELRKKVRTHLEAGAAEEADRGVRAVLIQKLVETHDIELPQSLWERRCEYLIEEFMSRLGSQRPPVSQEAALIAQLREKFEPEARSQVKADLILESVASQESIQVSEDDVDKTVE